MGLEKNKNRAGAVLRQKVRKNMMYIYKVYYKGELRRFFERRWEAEKYIEKRNNDFTLVVEEIA